MLCLLGVIGVASVVGVSLWLSPDRAEVLVIHDFEISWAHRQREVAVDQEIERLGPAHPWAGYYASGSGLDGEHVGIAPKAGYTFTENGCTGLCGFGSGTVEVTDVGLRFSASAGDDLPYALLSSDYVVVRWGDVRLLLSPREMDGFVGMVIRGEIDPREGLMGTLKSHVGVGGLVPGTRPELPGQWKSALDILDLELNVVEIVSQGEPLDLNGLYPQTVVRLDAGREQGIVAARRRDGDFSDSMPLVRDAANVNALALVIELHDDHCFAIVTTRPGEPVPEVGWTFVLPGMEVESLFWKL